MTILVPMQRSGSHDRGHPSSVQRDALCIMVGTTNGAGVKCGTLADLRSGQIRFTIPPVGLVPDGVARVQLRLHQRRYISASVQNNLYAVPKTGPLEPFTIAPARWLDARGHDVPRR